MFYDIVNNEDPQHLFNFIPVKHLCATRNVSITYLF